MQGIVTPSQDQAIGQKLPQEQLAKNKEMVKPSRQQLAPDKYLAELCNRADAEAEQDCKPRADIWNRNYNFFLGGLANMQGYSANGLWNHITDLSGLYASNNFAEKQMTLLSVLCRSNPKFKVTASAGSGDTEQREQEGVDAEYAKRSGAVIAQRITEYDSREKEPASFRLRKWFYRLNYGTSFGYINFDKDAGSQVQSPVMQSQEFSAGGMNICSKCGMTFPGQEPTPCKCGAPAEAVEHFQGESFTDDIHEGYESVMTGDTRLWSPSPWEVGLPSNAKLNVDNGELAWDFVTWNQKVRKKRIGYLFKMADTFTDDLTVPFMLRAQERLERRWTGQGIVQQKDFCTFRRYFFRPWMYYDAKFNQDTTLADGTECARGTRWIDYLPKGAYIARVGNMPLDIQPTNIDDHWSQAHYIYNPQSPWGKGIEDGADLQVIINALYQILIEHGRRDSVGITVINQDAGLDVDDFVGGKVVPAEMGVGGDADVRKAATMLSGNTMSQTLPATIEMARNDQTAVTGASSVLSGTNETLPDTATATQLLVQRATSILTPMMMMDVEQGQRVWRQNLKLRQKYQSAEAFMPFTDENEHEQGRYFSSSDIPQDFIVSAVDGSWMPSDSLDVRAEIEQALTMGQIPGGIWNPEFPKEAKQVVLNALTTLPRSLNKSESDESVAHNRLQAIKQGVQRVKAMKLPPQDIERQIQQILTMPSVKFRPDIDDTSVHIEVAQTFAKSILNDPQQDVDYFLVSVVEQYIQGVKAGGVEQMQEATASQTLAQLPQAQAEMAMGAIQQGNQPQEQPDTSGIEQEQVKQAGEVQKAQLASQDAAAQRVHEQGESDAQRQHEADGRAHDLKVAKMKPKGASK